MWRILCFDGNPARNEYHTDGNALRHTLHYITEPFCLERASNRWPQLMEHQNGT